MVATPAIFIFGSNEILRDVYCVSSIYLSWKICTVSIFLQMSVCVCLCACALVRVCTSTLGPYCHRTSEIQTSCCSEM